MKVKLQQLWDANQEALLTLGNAKQANVKASYWIGKAMKKIISELTDLNNSRNELVKKYGSEKDGSWTVAKEKIQIFNKEFKELLDTEIDLNINKLPFEYVESIQLSPGEFMALDWLISEPKEQPKESDSKKAEVGQEVKE